MGSLYGRPIAGPGPDDLRRRAPRVPANRRGVVPEVRPALAYGEETAATSRRYTPAAAGERRVVGRASPLVRVGAAPQRTSERGEHPSHPLRRDGGRWLRDPARRAGGLACIDRYLRGYARDGPRVRLARERLTSS